MTAPDQALEYATPPRAQWFSRRARVLTVAALIVAIGVTGYQTRRWWVRQLAHVRLIRLQNRALEEAAAVDAVAVEIKPRISIAMTGSDVGHRFLSATRYPRMFGRAPTQAVIFSHRLSNPNGVERLVIVEATYGPSPNTVGFSLRAYVFEIGSYFGAAPKPIPLASSSFFVSLLPVMDESVTCFRGQSDPNNASHFTIRFDVNGQSRSLDGWLVSNDMVLLEPHEGGDGWLRRRQSWLPKKPTAPATQFAPSTSFIPKKPGSDFGL